MEVENKQIIFKGYITGRLKESDMEVSNNSRVGIKVPNGSCSVVLKNIYLSCDPYMVGRMREFFVSHFPPFTPGSPIQGFGVAEVVDSDSPGLKAGDLVTGVMNWEQYTVVTDPTRLKKIEKTPGIPLSLYLGLLGMPGMTAYTCFYELSSARKEELVFVSAASGGVGQVIGQFAKLHGCYVVGSAGSDDKVHLLKNKLGFDDAFNYKQESDLRAALKRRFPDGIDIYFDHVGGEMFEAVLDNMRVHGRIIVCGMISQTSGEKTHGVRNLFNLIGKRIKVQGMLQSDHDHLYPRFLRDVVPLYRNGKIHYIEDVAQGLDLAPAALAGLFSGKNVGKQVIFVDHH